MASPIGVKASFSKWGLAVIKSELLWIWLPSSHAGCSLNSDSHFDGKAFPLCGFEIISFSSRIRQQTGNSSLLPDHKKDR